MQEDTNQEQPPPQVMPPPVPQVVYVNPARTTKTKPNWPMAISIISIGTAVIGALPVLIFVMSCIPSYGYYGRYSAGLSHFVFFFIGFILHGIAGIAGLVGMLNGARLAGLVGLIGNAIILLLAVIGLLIGVANI